MAHAVVISRVHPCVWSVLKFGGWGWGGWGGSDSDGGWWRVGKIRQSMISLRNNLRANWDSDSYKLLWCQSISFLVDIKLFPLTLWLWTWHGDRTQLHNDEEHGVLHMRLLYYCCIIQIVTYLRSLEHLRTSFCELLSMLSFRDWGVSWKMFCKRMLTVQ